MDRAHLAWPVAFTATGYATVEQDTVDDVASCLGVILSWPLGTHPTDPNFGVADQAFLQDGANLAEIKQAIVTSEPRAAELSLLQDDAQLAAFVASVQIGFAVRDEPAP